MPELHRILDKAAERFNLDNVKTHPSGQFLTVEVPITRAGVFRYFDERYEGNTRRDYKSIEALSSESFVDSLLGIPAVRLHPDVGMVDTSNSDQCDIVGAVHPQVSYTARKVKEQLSSDGLVRVLFTVFDGKAIDDIRSGKISELSLGGHCSRVYEPGQMESGTVYDAQQVDIVNNHLALVPAARAGDCTNIYKRFFAESSYDGADIGLTEPAANMSTTSTSKTFIMATKAKTETTLDAAELQSKLEATEALLADAKEKTVELEAKIADGEKAVEDMVSIADAKKLASSAVALTVAAGKLGQEITLDSIFESPSDAAKEVVSKISKGEKSFDSFDASLAYLQGKAEDIPAKGGETMAAVMDGKGSDSNAKPENHMAKSRSAAYKKLYS